MACGGCGKSHATRRLFTEGRKTRVLNVEYCVTTPEGERCFLVHNEARRFARKFGYPRPVPRNRTPSSN